MIGVFDSGIGGLTILKSFLEELPEYDYLYLGDNARTPYGNRSHDAVKSFTEEGVKYLFAQGCTLIIIACNTASSQVLRELQEEYLRAPGVTDKKILGVIKPLVEEAKRITVSGRIGVVGTRGTINSGSYEIELKNIDPDFHIYGQACPLLVPLIEENWSHKPETRMILKKYLHGLKSKNIDTLLLACTHYPFLIKDFRQIMGRKVKVPNPGEVVAKSLKDYLGRHPEIEKLLTKKGGRTFTTTDDPERFREIGEKFLGTRMKEVAKVRLG
ncbi:MAG TPA: glutamate racemase [Candidatus Gracilibacteria bacterium]|nr:glutamate racemase [Candidatus Gracilibacteria bacterium]